MAKSYLASPMLDENYKSGCGIIGGFQVPSNKKLTYDRRKGHLPGNGYQSKGGSLLLKCDETYEFIDDRKYSNAAGTVKANMVKLPPMQQIKNKIVSTETERVQYNSKPIGQLSKKRRVARKGIWTPFRIHLHGCQDAGVVERVQHSRQGNSLNQLGAIKKTYNSQVSLGNAMGSDYGQESIRGRNYNDLSDARDCQDIQDSLLVEHIQELPDCHNANSSSEDELSDARDCEKHIGSQNFHKHRIHRNFLKIMFEKKYQSPSKGSDEHQHSEIVILKAGRASLQKCGNRNESHGARFESFSHSVIKRKFGHAKLSFDFNKAEKVTTGKDSESSAQHEDTPPSGKGNRNSYFRHQKQSESSIYFNPLYERLSDGIEVKEPPGKNAPKSLERELSLPELDLLNVTSPPRRDINKTFVTSEMRYCAYGNCQNCRENNGRLEKERKNSCLSPKRETAKSRSQAYDKKSSGHLNIYRSKQKNSKIHFPDTEVLGKSLSSNGSTSSDTGNTEDNYLTDLYSGSNSTENSTALGTETVTDTESQYLGPDPSSTKDDQSSPTTVYQFPIEDVNSPANAETQPANPPEHCVQISFEEHSPKTNSCSCVYDNGSIFKYAKSLMQASSLNWDELIARSHASGQLSLFNEMMSASQCRVYHCLVFDLINEIILEVYHNWGSCIKPYPQPISADKNTVQEVVKCVDWHLFQQTPPQTLSHLVERDFGRSRTWWMDVGFNDEDIVTEMMDDILEEELIKEITFLIQIEAL